MQSYNLLVLRAIIKNEFDRDSSIRYDKKEVGLDWLPCFDAGLADVLIIRVIIV